MPVSRFRGLWLKIALPVLGFTMLGSLVLLFWLRASAERESANLFATLARTNAEFLRNARLPGSERVAGHLGKVLGMQVFFRHDAWAMSSGKPAQLSARRTVELVPPPEEAVEKHVRQLEHLTPEDGIVALGRSREAVAVHVVPEFSMILVRTTQQASGLLSSGPTLVLLGAFWSFSFTLAWAVTSVVVRPLRELTEELPRISRPSRAPLPGAERQDEIGQLARAFAATRHQLGEERQLREKAESFALLGRMATSLAHEIHNPLGAIRLHTQLLNTTPPTQLGAAARETLPILLDETRRIEGLVNEWMFLARPSPPQRSHTDLSALVAEVLLAHRAAASHARVQVFASIPSGTLALVDSRRISQVIRNVVLNAFQAMPEGGELRIATNGQIGASFIELIFRDTGPGFSAVAIERHQELFYSEREGGMGIGLTVSSEILRAHGGALRVGNAEPGGAMVTLILPTV